jgi:hypothetical protein
MAAIGGFAAHRMLDHPANVDQVAHATWVARSLAGAARRRPLHPETARA